MIVHVCFNDTATTEIYTLSLHDALPILSALTLNDENHYDANVALADLLVQLGDTAGAAAALERTMFIHPYDPATQDRKSTRLNSSPRQYLVCRLLLEKKKSHLCT